MGLVVQFNFTNFNYSYILDSNISFTLINFVINRLAAGVIAWNEDFHDRMSSIEGIAKKL